MKEQVSQDEVSNVSAWLVHFASGEQCIEIWPAETTIHEVITSLKNRYPTLYFQVKNINEGRFEISRTISIRGNTLGRGCHHHTALVLHV